MQICSSFNNSNLYAAACTYVSRWSRLIEVALTLSNSWIYIKIKKLLKEQNNIHSETYIILTKKPRHAKKK